ATYDSITGIVSQFDEDQQIIPRGNQDIITDASVVQPVYATPEAGTVPIGTEVILETRTDGAELYYTLDGSDPSEDGVLYDRPSTIEADVTMKSSAQTEDLPPRVVTEFSYSV